MVEGALVKAESFVGAVTLWPFWSFLSVKPQPLITKQTVCFEFGMLFMPTPVLGNAGHRYIFTFL